MAKPASAGNTELCPGAVSPVRTSLHLAELDS